MRREPSAPKDDASGSQTRRALQWTPWIVGVAILGGVVAFAFHFSETREFVRLTEQAKPWWLVLALVLQAATYVAQGEVLGCVTRAGRFPLSLPTLYKLSLSKLFVDQAVPSAGVACASTTMTPSSPTTTPEFGSPSAVYA